MMLTTSCEDMLTPDLDRYAEADRYAKDSVYGLFGVLRSIQNVAERNVLLGECRGDLVTAGDYTTDSIGNIINFGEMENGSSALLNVADYYHIVNSCNFYLANVDTVITQNNIKIMQREWAQVQAMRAWAYIQLVRLYGEVPFVTSPMSSTDEAERLQHSAPRVSAADLVDQLKEAGLQRALEVQNALGMPNYGSFSGGAGSYNSQRNLFPVQIVLGDAYLMQHNYEQAAAAYYDYFVNVSGQNPSLIGSLVSASSRPSPIVGIDTRDVTSGTLYRSVTTEGIANGEIISAASGAGTASDGYVFSTLLNATGFRIEKGLLSADERNLQVLPSQQFLTLAKAQRYNNFSMDEDLYVREGCEGGDGRRLAWAPENSFRNGNKQHIIAKYAYSSDQSLSDNTHYISFTRNYHIPLYRTTAVLLRFAEAINRLGFPQLAFGILKDGLFTENLPNLIHINHVLNDTIFKYNTEGEDVISIDTIPFIVIGNVTPTSAGIVHVDYTRNPDIVVYEAGNEKICVGDTILLEPYDGDIDALGSGIANLTLADIPEDIQESWSSDLNAIALPEANTHGMYYLSFEERKKMENYPFLNFKTPATIWNNANLLSEDDPAYGIHSRGCGKNAGIEDSVYTYAHMVAEKVAEELIRTNQETIDLQVLTESLYNGDDLLVIEKYGEEKGTEMIINAVENLIVDEAALESCFEGHRFTDLIRIAEHKNEAGLNGTDWLAWKVARRDKSYTAPAADVDAALKGLLLNKTNWYLPMP